MRRWFLLVVVTVVVAVVCQLFQNGRLNEWSDQHQVPHRWRLLTRGACMDFSDERRFYVIYDRTFEQTLPDGSSSLPVGAGVVPDMRPGGISHLSLGGWRYPLSEGSVYWVSKHKGAAQVTVRPLNVDQLLEDFVAFSLDDALAQPKIATGTFTLSGGAATHKPDCVFKSLSLENGTWQVLYAEAEGVWIVNDGSCARDEISLENADASSALPVLSAGDTRVPLAQNTLYWLTKAADKVQVEVAPFSLGHCLFRLNHLIGRDHCNEAIIHPPLGAHLRNLSIRGISDFSTHTAPHALL